MKDTSGGSQRWRIATADAVEKNKQLTICVRPQLFFMRQLGQKGNIYLSYCQICPFWWGSHKLLCVLMSSLCSKFIIKFPNTEKEAGRGRESVFSLKNDKLCKTPLTLTTLKAPQSFPLSVAFCCKQRFIFEFLHCQCQDVARITASWPCASPTSQVAGNVLTITPSVPESWRWRMAKKRFCKTSRHCFIKLKVWNKCYDNH